LVQGVLWCYHRFKHGRGNPGFFFGKKKNKKLQESWQWERGVALPPTRSDAAGVLGSGGSSATS